MPNGFSYPYHLDESINFLFLWLLGGIISILEETSVRKQWRT